MLMSRFSATPPAMRSGRKRFLPDDLLTFQRTNPYWVVAGAGVSSPQKGLWKRFEQFHLYPYYAPFPTFEPARTCPACHHPESRLHRLLPAFRSFMLRTCIAIAAIGEALTTPARHVVPLHRQRVPVQGEDDRISYKSVYFGSVTVGSPEQKFAVVFDTGSGHVIIPSSECHSETCRIHNRYNREASPAAVDVDYDGSPVQAGSPRDQITVAFGTGEVTGQFVQDRLCLGSHGAAPAAPAIAVPSYTEPLLLVQSGEAELGRTPSAQKGQTKALGNASNAMLLSQALNCVDLRVVMATEMTEEPFHAFSFDGVPQHESWACLTSFWAQATGLYMKRAPATKRSGDGARQRQKSRQALIRLTKEVKSSRRWETALQLLQDVPPTVSVDLIVVSSGIGACGRCKQWHQALRVLGLARGAALESDRLDLQTISATISACEKSARWSPALRCLDSLHCGQLETDAVALSAAVSACGQGSAWTRALCIFAAAALGAVACNSAISGCERDTESCSHLAVLSSQRFSENTLQETPTHDYWIQCRYKRIGGGSFNAWDDRQWQRSCSLFTSLLEVPLVPTIVTFGAAASSLAAARRWRRSLHVLDQLKHWKVTANVVVFNAVLSALAVARRPELARNLLDEYRTNCDQLLGLRVTSACFSHRYNSAIAACESVGAWEEAWHLLMEMKNRRLLPDLFSFNSAISCCTMSGSWQRASHLFLSLQAGLAPDVVSTWEHVSCFGAFIGACAGVGQWQQALAFVSSMNLYQLVPNLLTVNSVASALETLGKLEAKQKIGVRVRGEQECISSLVLHEKGCQWQRVLQLLTYDADLITYNCALLACERAGQWRAAAQLLATMEEAFVQADLVSFNTAGVLCERHGCWEWLEVCLGRLADMLQQELVKETVGSPEKAASLDSLALAPQFSFFGMMAKQVSLEHPSFGVFLADTDAEVSEISFGGSSEDKVASPLTWAPVALPDLGYWQVEIKAIRIGDRTLDYCADGQCRAVVDTGTSLLAVPEDFADGLQEALEQRLEDPDQGDSFRVQFVKSNTENTKQFPPGLGAMTEILGGFVKDAFPELFVEGQVVSAEQNFHRRLAENIEQQKLFREDLRDLVELTVGRMDVYHLVGALLLEFCIHFYCENRMIEEAGKSQSKAFLVVFFLLSNLRQALGEWLSMHASVASHSIGVRLLTSFARLSIPTRKELEEVAKAPLVPMMERFRQLGKRLGVAQGRAGEGSAGDGSESREAAVAAVRQETVDLARAAAGLGAVAREPESDLAIQEGAKGESDIDPDLVSGMNQLLCALSYYILGAIAEETPSGAAVSLFGVQCLALLLLRLDVAEGRVQSWGAVIMVLVCMSFPPMYMGVLIHFVDPASVRTVEFLALPAFILHSMWMLLIAAYLVPGSMDEDPQLEHCLSQDAGLPKQLRTVLYLDVLHLDQTEIAEELAAQHQKDSLAGLQEAKMGLQQAMRAILEEEASDGTTSSSRRTREELLELEERTQIGSPNYWCLQASCQGPFLPNSAAMESQARGHSSGFICSACLVLGYVAHFVEALISDPISDEDRSNTEYTAVRVACPFMICSQCIYHALWCHELVVLKLFSSEFKDADLELLVYIGPPVGDSSQARLRAEVAEARVLDLTASETQPERARSRLAPGPGKRRARQLGA
eukprot:s341_g29.t2